MNDTKIDLAIEQISRLVDDLSSPEMMTREEALAFYRSLSDEIDMKREALEEVKDG